ncbi:MAG: FliM/FliN family flagellar motor switch protein [Cellvibrio sp.]
MNMLVNQYLPSLSELWLTTINQWVLCRSNLRATIASGDLELKWSADDFTAPVVVIRFASLEHRWALALQSLTAIDARLHGEPFMLMPETLRTFTLQKILNEFLAQFPPAVVANLHLAKVEWNFEAELESWQRFPFDLFNLTQGTQTKAALIVEEPKTLKWLSDQLPFAKVKKTDLAGSLDIQTRLHLGTTLLPLQEIKQLGIGDLLWIQNAHHTKRGLQLSFDVTADNANTRFQAHWRHTKLTIARHIADGASILTENQNYFAERSTMQIEIEQLELPITFDLGELSFPISDIELLAPDYVFELPTEAADAIVNLRVHGKLIAQGNLVTVGRRLAVRLTQVSTGNKEITEG